MVTGRPRRWSASDGLGFTLSDYDARVHPVLEGLEAVRQRPGMYSLDGRARDCTPCVRGCGTTRGTRLLAGYARSRRGETAADGGVRVFDNCADSGRSEHPVEKAEALEIVMTTIAQRGGKFDGNVVRGLRRPARVGISDGDALSTRCRPRDRGPATCGRRVRARRHPPPRRLQAVQKGDGDEPQTGPNELFWTDSTIFESTECQSRPIQAAQETASSTGGCEISMTDERPQGRLSRRGRHPWRRRRPRRRKAHPGGLFFEYPGGIADFVAT